MCIRDRLSAAQRAELPGVSVNRSHQVLAGAMVIEAVMDLVGIEALVVCPWALREGVILQRLDLMPDAQIQPISGEGLPRPAPATNGTARAGRSN